MSNRLRVRVPHAASVLTFPSGDMVTVKLDEDGPYADVLEDDLALIMISGSETSVPWREANPTLINRLKPPSRISAVRVVNLQRAADMARPINPFDRASIARDALAAWRGAR